MSELDDRLDEGLKKWSHIMKFKRDGPCPLPPHNMPLWYDINILLVEHFNLNPTSLEVRFKDAAQLISDLEARFDGKYDLNEVTKMLQVEYKRSETGSYRFLKTDFIKEVIQ